MGPAVAGGLGVSGTTLRLRVCFRTGPLAPQLDREHNSDLSHLLIRSLKAPVNAPSPGLLLFPSACKSSTDSLTRAPSGVSQMLQVPQPRSHCPRLSTMMRGCLHSVQAADIFGASIQERIAMEHELRSGRQRLETLAQDPIRYGHPVCIRRNSTSMRYELANN